MNEKTRALIDTDLNVFQHNVSGIGNHKISLNKKKDALNENIRKIIVDEKLKKKLLQYSLTYLKMFLILLFFTICCIFIL